MFLEANVTSKGLMKNLVCLNPEQMKVFFLTSLPGVKDINVTIKDLGKLLKVLILQLMKHAGQQENGKQNYGNQEAYHSQL